MTLKNILSAIIFVAEQPISEAALLEIVLREEELAPPSLAQLREALAELVAESMESAQPFAVQHLAGGYQWMTKREFYPYVRHVATVNSQKKLSRAALETLSIIAYRQPVTKAEIEFIRGVSSDYAVQKLLDRNLISIAGRADAPGRPLLYSTSPYFMQFFGINGVEDLPKLKDFELSEEEHLQLFRQSQQE